MPPEIWSSGVGGETLSALLACPVDGAGTRQNLWDVGAQPPPASRDRHAGQSLSGKKCEMPKHWLLGSRSHFSIASEQSGSWSWETV